jgi:hypothetical protein
MKERGVVAANHYDTGQNMVGMITGAKRYILFPPNSCQKLGIITNDKSPIRRHASLNYGHVQYLHDPDQRTRIPKEEKAWLEKATTAPAVETVLKEGEILFIPSYWFHYIISIQKSAQCNVRSGDEDEQTVFGGKIDVSAEHC